MEIAKTDVVMTYLRLLILISCWLSSIIRGTEAAMFLRRYTHTKDGKTHTYYTLVESIRTEAGPRQHIVAYLGELNHDEQKRWQRTP